MRGSCDGGQGWDPLCSPLSALLRHQNSGKRTAVLGGSKQKALGIKAGQGWQRRTVTQEAIASFHPSKDGQKPGRVGPEGTTGQSQGGWQCSEDR